MENKRLEVHDPGRTNLWAGLGVGLGVAALLGVGALLMVLLRRRQEEVSSPGSLGVTPPAPFFQGLPQGGAGVLALLSEEDEEQDT